MNLQEDELLSKYCTYQIGGAADYFVEAQSREEVLEALDWAVERDLPVFVFGGGSNVLFDDAGFRGLVIRVKSGGLRVDGEEMVADAGVLMAKVVQAAYEAGLTGLEEWTGLPGTVGGAVRGNAGCFGKESKDILIDAEVWIPGKGVKTMTVDDFQYSYRHSRLKEEEGVVLNARFKLGRGEKEAIQTKMREIAKSRIQKQPAGSSTGSFFKNPPGDHAGRLIEAAGLKGLTFGKARVSPEHANFFMNLGGATSADVLHLVQEVEASVLKKFGIALEREVRVVAENPKK